MNLKNFDRAVIDSAFVFNKGLVEQERLVEKERLQNLKRIEEAKAFRKERKRRALRNSINSHYANLVKFVKEIFSQPSELSNFVLSIVLEKKNKTIIITRNTWLYDDSQVQNVPSELSGGIPMRIESKSFIAIKLVKIPNLQDENREYFVALLIPFSEAKHSADDLKDIDVVVCESVVEKGGFFHTEESYGFVPSTELRDVLKSLCDINIFCKVLLESY